MNLSVTNSSGIISPATVTNTTSIANYINVSAALPIPFFTGTPTSGYEPLSVQFNDTTPGTGIQDWNWSFGDATWFNTTALTAKNVTHPYSSAWELHSEPLGHQFVGTEFPCNRYQHDLDSELHQRISDPADPGLYRDADIRPRAAGCPVQ